MDIRTAYRHRPSIWQRDPRGNKAPEILSWRQEARGMLGVILFFVLLWSASFMADAAPYCLENGGNYVGCVEPLGMRWESEDGNYHFSLEGAARASADYAVANVAIPSQYNLGLKTSSQPWRLPERACHLEDNGVSPNHTDLFTMETVGSYSSKRVYVPIYIHGKHPHPDCPYRTITYSRRWGTVHGMPLCPAGYYPNQEYVDGGPLYGFMCIPGESNEFTLANAKTHSEFSCQDTVGSVGQASTGMPVNIATRCKSQSVRDIQTQGPWPIGWDRHFGVDSSRDGWRMGIKSHLSTGLHSDGLVWVGIRRPWGQTLLFKASPTMNTPRNWTSGMNNAPVFQSHLEDVWSGSSLSHWLLRQVNGEVETYGRDGVLVRRSSPDGFLHHYFYDEKGRVEAIKDDFGNNLTISYVVDGGYQESGTYTWEGEDGSAQEHTSSYSSSWEDPLFQSVPEMVSDGSRVVGYAWSIVRAGSRNDFNAQLDQVLWDNGTERTYLYGEQVNGRRMGGVGLTGEVDEEGRRVRTYEPVSGNSRLIGKEWKGGDPDGNGALERLTLNTSSVVDQDGRTFYFSKGGSSTHSSNRIRAYTTPCPECDGIQGNQLTYDSNGFLIQVRDWRNNITTMTYDTAGRVISLTESSGTPLARTTKYEYPAEPYYRDPVSKSEQVLDEDGIARIRTTTYAYSDLPIMYGPDSPCILVQPVPCPSTVRKLTSISTLVDDGSSPRVWEISYLPNGLRNTVVFPSGKTVRWTWNSRGEVASITDGHGTGMAVTRYFGGHGPWGPTWQENENGLVTRWTYDQRGRIIREELGIPGALGIGEVTEGIWSTTDGSWRTTLMEWFDNGFLKTSTSPGGLTLSFSYNAADKPVAITAKDALGSVIWTQELEWSPAGLLLSSSIKDASDAPVLTQSQTHNALQLVESMVDSRNHATLLGHDTNGSLISIENPLGAESSRGIDTLGRPSTLTDALNGIANLSYGPQDEVRSATDQRGVSTTYSYNGFGDLLSIHSPDRGSWVFVRDGAGRILSSIDPRGVEATHAYDLLDRVVTILHSDAGITGTPAGFSGGDVSHTFTYDSCAYGLGRLCSFTDSSGTTAYSYNAWGEVVGKAWTGAPGTPGAGVTLATGYSYDEETGRLETVSLPSGQIMAVSYGPDGRPSSLAYGVDTVAANIQWTAFYAVKGWTWPMAAGWSGIHSQVSFGYDLDGRPVSVEDLNERSLVWDPASRLVGVDDADDALHSQLYGYDALDRLTEADIGAWLGGKTYGYDPVGNRTSLLDDTNGNGWGYAYGLADNRQGSRWPITAGVPGNPIPSVYDAMGNLIQDGMGLGLSYDATGRLVQGTNGIAMQTSDYNALGQRMFRQVAGGPHSGTRLYAYDEEGRPLGAYVPDASAPNGFRVLEEYVHLDGWRPIATVRPDPVHGMNAPRIHPILTDHLGTPRKVLDGGSGEVRWDWDAKDPFGHQAANESPTPGLALFAFELRFPGQRHDPALGLYHNGFRDYHPGLGRYVQSDPLGLEAGWNTYGYVSSSPTILADELGLSERDVAAIKNRVEKKIENMVNSGIRYPGRGMLNASINNFQYTLGSLSRGRWGKPHYQVCVDQAVIVESDLQTILPDLDDKWELTPKRSWAHQTRGLIG